MRIKIRVPGERCLLVIGAACLLSLIGSAEAQAARGNILPGNILDQLWMRGVCLCEKSFSKTQSHPSARNLSGCICGSDQSAGPVQVRMLDVRSARIANTRVDGTGKFSFKNVGAGEYVLLATQGPRILGLQTIRLPLDVTPVVMNVRPRIEIRGVEYLERNIE